MKSYISRLSLSLVLLAGFTEAAGLSFPEHQPPPLQPEDAFSMLYLQNEFRISLSPDGRVLAYTLEDRSKKVAEADLALQPQSGTAPPYLRGCDVWITKTGSGVSRNLTQGKGSSWGPVWSPDGRLLAFYSDRGGREQVWIWERSSGRMRQASSATARSGFFDSILWTPDGKHLVVSLRPEQGFEPSKPASKQAITEAGASPKEEPGPTVAVYRSPPAPAGSQDRSSPPPSYLERSRSDIALIELASGEVRRLARNVTPRSWIGISPQGERIAFIAIRPLLPSAVSYQAYYDLFVIDLVDGQKRTLASNVPINVVNAVAWSPDGEMLSYSTGGPVTERKVVVVPARGGTPLVDFGGAALALDDGGMPPLWEVSGRFLYILAHQGGLWRVSVPTGAASEVARIPGKAMQMILSYPDLSLVWSPDQGRSLAVIAHDEKTMKSSFYKVELETGKSTLLMEEDKTYGSNRFWSARRTGVSPASQSVFFVAESARQSADIWIADTGFRRVKQVTRFNPKMDPAMMGERRTIEWNGRDGKPHRGLLLLPSGYREGRRHPLIVFVYQESMSYANSFGFWGGFFNMQLFATRGYAVLYPDIQWERDGRLMQGLADAVLPGIDKTIEMGVADPDKVGVMGHSSGGYCALALAVQWPKFKAAVESAGPGNMFTFWGIPLSKDGISFGTPWVETQMGMGGTPWEYRDRYIQNSPWFFLDKLTAPLLILVGTADLPGVPQADEIFSGLRRLGKEAEYAKYENEVHAEEWWSPINKLDAAKRIIRWFETHMGPDD